MPLLLMWTSCIKNCDNLCVLGPHADQKDVMDVAFTIEHNGEYACDQCVILLLNHIVDDVRSRFRQEVNHIAGPQDFQYN